MNNRLLCRKNYWHFMHNQFLNIRLYSDATVRVRFAPSPTGMYFITVTTYKLFCHCHYSLS